MWLEVGGASPVLSAVAEVGGDSLGQESPTSLKFCLTPALWGQPPVLGLHFCPGKRIESSPIGVGDPDDQALIVYETFTWLVQPVCVCVCMRVCVCCVHMSQILLVEGSNSPWQSGLDQWACSWLCIATLDTWGFAAPSLALTCLLERQTLGPHLTIRSES